MTGFFFMPSTLQQIHLASIGSISEVLLESQAQPSPDDKLHTAIRVAHAIRKATDLQRGVQLLYLDIGTPGGKSDQEGELCLYRYIREVLIALGESPSEIAFVHDYPGSKLLSLEKAIRSGDLRYVLGSRDKLGVGRNIQDRLIAIHHLDCPLSPRKFIQSEGRIDRQGNRWESAFIFYYGMTGSPYESWVRTTIAYKRHLSQSLRAGSIADSTVSDLSLTAADLEAQSALLSANEDYFQYHQARIAHRRAVGRRVAHERQIRSAYSQLATLPDQIARYSRLKPSPENRQRIEQAKTLLDKLPGDLRHLEAILPALKEQEQLALAEERRCHQLLGTQQDPPPYKPPRPMKTHKPSSDLIQAIKSLPPPQGFDQQGQPIDWHDLVLGTQLR